MSVVIRLRLSFKLRTFNFKLLDTAYGLFYTSNLGAFLKRSAWEQRIELSDVSYTTLANLRIVRGSSFLKQSCK